MTDQLPSAPSDPPTTSTGGGRSRPELRPRWPRGDWRRLQRILTLALAIVFSALGVSIVAGEVAALVRDPSSASQHVFTIARLAAVTLLVIDWAWGADVSIEALENLDRWWPGMVPALPKVMNAFIVADVGALLAMAVFYGSASLFAFAFVFLKASEIASMGPIEGHIRDAVARVYTQPETYDDKARAAVDEVLLYSVTRAWPLLHAVMVAGGALCAGAGILSAATSDATAGSYALAASSLGILLLIICQEVVTWRWRHQYQSAIDSIVGSLS